MSSTRWRISSWQLLVVVFSLALCVTPFALMRVLMPVLGARQAWLGTLPALAAGLWGTAVATRLSRRFTGVPLDRAVVAVLGPFLGYPYIVLLMLLFLTGAPANMLVFSTVAHTVMLPYLPHAYVAVMIAAVGTYAAALGPEAIARCAGVLAPLLAAGLALIFLPLPTAGHLGALLPLRGFTWPAWLSLPVVATAGTIRGFLPLLVLGPLTAPPRSQGRLLAAAGLAWLLVTAAVALPVAVFDAPLASEMSLPFLSAEAMITWRWLPVRNLVPLTMLVWYAVTFLVFATYLWMGVWLLERLIPALPRIGPAIGLGAAAAAAGSLDLTEPAVRTLFIVWNVAVVVLGLLVPTGLVLLRRPERRLAAGAAP